METVIWMPVLLLGIVLIAQVSVWLLAQHTAQAAASAALDSARVDGGSAASGRAAGQQLLQGGGLGRIRDPRLEVQRGTDTVTVTVEGRVPTLLPLLDLHIARRATAPVERYTPDGAR
ncbi:hypothetical protein Aru02nite_57690 [Actinocatenispora rupis]|uniref:TadE-like domain-containing protein n=1 Tax=Actinocatenispora rupis TaxID=519421 RepID=A0A8J3J525_9ACTN|nr:hypothetical protein Aru02nite_57690 [Actinocatenispora rupis]